MRNKVKFYIRIILIVVSIVVMLVIITVGAMNMKVLVKQYNELSNKPVNSARHFKIPFGYITMNQDGSVNIQFATVSQASNIGIGVDDLEFEGVTPDDETQQAGPDYVGNGDAGGITYTEEDTKINFDDYVVPFNPKDGDILIRGWLVLHSEPSVNGYLNTGHLSVEGYYGSWSMGEGQSGLNRYMRQLYSDDTWSRPIINGKEVNRGIVNRSGRYWVAIGPSWFNPDLIDSNGVAQLNGDSLGASYWFSDGIGHNFDIAVKFNGENYYIYACVGDAKAHTFGDGLGYCQSGYNWDLSECVTSTRGAWQPIEWPMVDGKEGARLDVIMDFQGLICE